MTGRSVPREGRGSQPADLLLVRPAPSRRRTDYNLGFEFDKRITETSASSSTAAIARRDPTRSTKTANGWNNIVVTLKYIAVVNAEHEFIPFRWAYRGNSPASGANGSNGAVLGNDDSGSTGPTLYFGKGFGDVPVGVIRPVVF